MRRLAAIAAGIFFISCAFAAPPPDVSPARMDQIVQYYVDKQQFTGAVLVARGDTVLFSKAYGSANLEWNIPNTATTKFRIGSLTKQFTAAAILLLEERARLTIEDPIKKFYPDAPAAWEKITLRQLLAHTSGIPNYTQGADFEKFQSWRATPDELVKRVRDLPLDFEPGAEMRYSNTGYALLGSVVEKAGGASYAQFLRDNIFKPLGLADTGYDESAIVLPQRAAGYSPGPAGLLNAGHTDMSTPFSAGALYSTVEDLLRWERALFGNKLLAPRSLEKMTTPGKNEFGFGLRITQSAGHKVIEHNGGISGFNSKLAWYPQDEVVVVALSNLNGSGADNIVDKLGALTHGKAVVLPSERAAVRVSADVLKKYLGTYEFGPQFKLSIVLEGDHLAAQAAGQPIVELFAESATSFFPKLFEATFVFQTDASGKAVRLVLRQQGSETVAPRVNEVAAQQ